MNVLLSYWIPCFLSFPKLSVAWVQWLAVLTGSWFYLCTKQMQFTSGMWVLREAWEENHSVFEGEPTLIVSAVQWKNFIMHWFPF